MTKISAGSMTTKFGAPMQPWFIATERFGPQDGDAWIKYVQLSGLNQLDELVSLDPMLCNTVLPEIKDEYWPYMVNEDFMLNFFIDLEFLLDQITEIDERNILCVFRDPTAEPVAPKDVQQFDFLGYDLVDVMGSASALSNCGGFPDVFANRELTRHGLLSSRARAYQIQKKLRESYPEEPHADCYVWAVFRATDQ